MENKWTDKHYDGDINLSKSEIKEKKIRVDVYKFYESHKIHMVDKFGILFHTLKAITRFGKKNEDERDLKAMIIQPMIMARYMGYDFREIYKKEIDLLDKEFDDELKIVASITNSTNEKIIVEDLWGNKKDLYSDNEIWNTDPEYLGGIIKIEDEKRLDSSSQVTKEKSNQDPNSDIFKDYNKLASEYLSGLPYIIFFDDFKHRHKVLTDLNSLGLKNIHLDSPLYYDNFTELGGIRIGVQKEVSFIKNEEVGKYK